MFYNVLPTRDRSGVCVISENSHQLLLYSVSHSQFHTEQANVLHNNNEQKLMSYCSSLAGGLSKMFISCDRICYLGDMQIPRRARTRVCSSIDRVGARFQRRSQKKT